MSDLELRVAQGLMRFRALELAVHSPYGWEMTAGDERVIAVPWKHSDGIEFVGVFDYLPANCSVTLWHDGHEVLSRPYDGPADAECELAWNLCLGEEQHA